MFLRLTLVTCLVVAASAQTADPRSELLFSAIQRGATADVERVLGSGASPNAVDGEGLPALMAAALFADADMMDVLLKRGASRVVAFDVGHGQLDWGLRNDPRVVVIERNAKLAGLVKQLGLTSVKDLRKAAPLVAAIEKARPVEAGRLTELVSAVRDAARQLAEALSRAA